MQVARKLLALVVPGTLAISAFLHATAISALVEATAQAAPPLPLSGPSPVSASVDERPSADAIVRRNPFEHGALAAAAGPATDCTGVRALVVVRAADEDASIAALDVGGSRLVRRRGGSAGNMQVARIGTDRVWLARGGEVCEARVFAPAVAVQPTSTPAQPTRGIARVGPSEVHVDRGVLDRYLESPGELARVRVVPDASGVRIVKVPPDSVVALLGLQDGDRIVSAGGIEMTSPEKILELCARIRTVERLSMVVVRNGKPMTMDYVVR